LGPEHGIEKENKNALVEGYGSKEKHKKDHDTSDFCSEA
jgi:hypothetical protein